MLGLAALVVAFYCIFRPGVAASTVIWVIAAWLIVRGVFELFAAFGGLLLLWLAFTSRKVTA